MASPHLAEKETALFISMTSKLQSSILSPPPGVREGLLLSFRVVASART